MAEEEKDAGESTNPSEVAKQWLDTDEGKAWMQSTLDRTVAKALKTHDEKKAPEWEQKIEAAREDGRKESKLTAEDQIAKLRQEWAEDKRQSELREKRIQWRAAANEAGLEARYADAMDGSLSIDAGIEVITAQAEANEARLSELRNKDLIQNSHKPGGGSSGEEQTEQAYDPYDMSPENMAKAMAVEEKRIGA